MDIGASRLHLRQFGAFAAFTRQTDTLSHHIGISPMTTMLEWCVDVTAIAYNAWPYHIQCAKALSFVMVSRNFAGVDWFLFHSVTFGNSARVATSSQDKRRLRRS